MGSNLTHNGVQITRVMTSLKQLTGDDLEVRESGG